MGQHARQGRGRHYLATALCCIAVTPPSHTTAPPRRQAGTHLPGGIELWVSQDGGDDGGAVLGGRGIHGARGLHIQDADASTQRSLDGAAVGGNPCAPAAVAAGAAAAGALARAEVAGLALTPLSWLSTRLVAAASETMTAGNQKGSNTLLLLLLPGHQRAGGTQAGAHTGEQPDAVDACGRSRAGAAGWLAGLSHLSVRPPSLHTCPCSWHSSVGRRGRCGRVRQGGIDWVGGRGQQRPSA